METICLECSYNVYKLGKVFRAFNGTYWSFTMQYFYDYYTMPIALRNNSYYIEDLNLYLTYHIHNDGKLYYDIPHLVHKEADELFQISTVIDLPIQMELLLSAQKKGLEIFNTKYMGEFENIGIVFEY